MNLYQIARALGGEVSNGWARVPAPGHSKADRSLSIALSHQSPDGLYYLPYAGETWQECAEYVRSRLGITPERRERPTAKRQSPQPPQSGPSDARKRANAREIFSETVEPRDTIVERYFEVERGLPNIIDDVLAMTIRYHARCPFKDDDKLVRAPALVAALRDPHAAMHACSHLDDMDAIERRFLADPANVVAVQRIRLDADGHKVERRSLGPLGNGVVFVSSIFESFYSATATLAEGVESALAARKLGFTGVVAMTGCSRFRTLYPPWIWQSLTICAENDAASENAWRAAVPRWRAAGHRVRVVAPPVGDANDYLKGAHHGR